MLPNVSSIEDTKKQIVYYAVILILSSYLPYLDNNVGIIYLTIVTILNLLLFNSSLKLKNLRKENQYQILKD